MFEDTHIPRRTPGRRARASIGLLLVGVAVLASCAAPPPARGETVPLRFPYASATHSEVTYGPRAEHVADVHLPTGGGNKGVIVLLHGGGFVGREGFERAAARADMANASGAIMRQTHRGFAVVNISYRLTDGHANVFPAAVHDASLAVQWVRRHGHRYGLNPDTVVISGGSAGGTIAALVGTGSNSHPHEPIGRTARVDGWVSLAGIYDFTTRDELIAKHARAWLGWNAQSPAWLRAASPVTHLDRRDPPGFVVHGDLDDVVPVGQAHTLLGAAGAAGVEARRMFYDIVSTGEPGCRWHIPACGMNASTLDDWFDRVVARTL